MLQLVIVVGMFGVQSVERGRFLEARETFRMHTRKSAGGAWKAREARQHAGSMGIPGIPGSPGTDRWRIRLRNGGSSPI